MGVETTRPYTVSKRGRTRVSPAGRASGGPFDAENPQFDASHRISRSRYCIGISASRSSCLLRPRTVGALQPRPGAAKSEIGGVSTSAALMGQSRAGSDGFHRVEAAQSNRGLSVTKCLNIVPGATISPRTECL